MPQKGFTSQDLEAILAKNPSLKVEEIKGPASSDKDKTKGKGKKKPPSPKTSAGTIAQILQKPKRSQVFDPTHGMNDTEKRLSRELEVEKLLGNILGFHFEKIGLQLAPKTWYFPDFVVFMPDGCMHVIEVKGFLRDDAAAKYKVAVGMFPEITFHMVRSENQSWKEMYGKLLEPPIPTDGKNCRITLR